MNIDELHEESWVRLQARRHQLPHALLLVGQRGLGKLELARQFAGALLCEHPKANGCACNACLACNWYSQEHHPDFRLLQPEVLAISEEEEVGENKRKASQQITIDQIRRLDDFFHIGTHRNGLRIVLICPAEAMNRSTANALLKTLEEPAPETLFLLVSDEAERLLPTIRSRCQLVQISAPIQESAYRWLTKQNCEEPARWLALAGGAPILALELSRAGERVILETLISHLVCGGTLTPLIASTALEKVLKSEKRINPTKRAVEWLQKWVLDLSLANAGLPIRYFVTEQANIAKLAQSTSAQKLQHFMRKAIQSRRYAEHPLNSRLLFEDIFLSYAALFSSS